MIFFDWDPFEEMQRLREEIDMLMKGFVGERRLLEGKAGKCREIKLQRRHFKG